MAVELDADPLRAGPDVDAVERVAWVAFDGLFVLPPPFEGAEVQQLVLRKVVFCLRVVDLSARRVASGMSRPAMRSRRALGPMSQSEE
ncbi:hypothetical protein ASG77_20860 [Arthrobacter sp. Soil762]|nr:hypothetical protein ASG77_20860 [Arthrobacter sp. Soil762]